MSRRTSSTLAALTAVTLGVPLAVPATATAGPMPLPAASAAAYPVASGRLTNLAHLNFLGDRVAVAPVPGHTTYRLAAQPRIGVLWTYADFHDGVYRRVGGGTYDPATNTYGQGAFNADDLTRAAVVYLRHWRQTGSASSRRSAYELLRGVMYLQTSSGPNAGNVVLWMQPDGTLNPSPRPVELPDPSDSADSYWLARTVWALGEGYAAFKHVDPAFAAYLRARLDLSVRALDREVLKDYGRWQVVDGVRRPVWLVVDGADATAEAVLGLAAYVRAGGGGAARTALHQLAAGIAALSAGDARHWPMGAVLPWALSRSVWHAWASQMPAALARASTVLREPRLMRPAVRDSATFVPWLLTSGGPDNGRLPLPIDRTKIAYGIDSRVQSLIATARATGRPSFEQLAGVTAAWFFGANAAGVPAYDPRTGRTVDGIAADGTVNRNGGAESTIHGLLTMLALDAHPTVARVARVAAVRSRVGTTVVEAESGTLTGPARVVTPASAWTGESQFSGGSYVALGAGGRLALTLPRLDQRQLVMPVVDLQPGSSAISLWRSGGRWLGFVRSGAVGPQGVSPAPGALLPVTLARWLPAGSTRLQATAWAAHGDEARVDAVALEPRVSSYTLTRGARLTVLLRTPARVAVRSVVRLPGSGRVVATSYDARGRAVQRTSTAGDRVGVQVEPGGFTLVRR